MTTPEHPVVRLATERIEELSDQADSLAVDLADLESVQSKEPEPREIEAILNSIPDLREQLERAEGEELIELLDLFDVRVSYDKPGQILMLSVLLNSDFPNPPDATTTGYWSQGFEIAGAGSVQIGTTGCRYREWHETRSLSRSFADRLAASRLEPVDARCSGR
jgi:hypothetical protein